MKGKIRYLVFSVLTMFSLIAAGCSSDLENFQQVEEIEYSLSTILDDYPALRNLIYSLSLNEVSKGSVALIYENEEAYRQTKDDLELLLMDRKRPAQKSIKLVKKIIERLVGQDSLDREEEVTNYAENFYGFVDLVRSYDFSIREDLLQVMVLANRYSLEQHTPEVMRETAQDAIDNLTDPVDKDLAVRGLEDTLRLVSKLCIQSDQPMWLSSSGNLITEHNKITDYNQMLTDGAAYIGLGHSTRGLNSLLMAVTDIARDPDVRTILKDVITQASDMTAMGIDAGAGEKEPWEIIRDMMTEDYDHFHAGGSKYGSSAGMSHGESYNQVYGRNDSDVYSNSEHRNLANFSNALGLGMFLRSDRPESLISSVDPKKKVTDPDYENDDKHKHYFVDKLFENLKNINFDPESQHLEESLYDLIRHDTFGRDRRNYNSGANWNDSNSAWPVAYLEQFLFLSAMSQNCGWFDGGTTSEDTPLSGDASVDHGHGVFAGGITLNDSLFAMGGTSTLGFNTYSLAFVNGRSVTHNKNQRDAIHRNSRTFFRVDDFWGGKNNGSNSSPFKAGYNQNYFAQRFMSGAGPGDIGIPTGGNPDGGEHQDTINGFQPFVADGIGDTNTSRFLLYWMARICWNGEGPYYYKPISPETVTFTHYDPDSSSSGEDIWEIYERSNGRVYALKNTRTGRYLYPADGCDPEDPFTDGFGDSNTGSMTFSDYAIDELDNPWNAPINCGDGPDGKLAQVNGRRQRHNRYKSAWYSDYYLIDMESEDAGWNETHFFVAPDNEDGIRSVWEGDYADGGGDWPGMNNPAVRNFEAGRFKFEEMIAEGNPDRACASHVEAMYRNYQWLVAEKKMAIVVPMNLYLVVIDISSDEQVGMFQIMEGNGIAGLTGARFCSGNNVWAYQGNSQRNSTVPGDFRIRFLFQASNGNGQLGDVSKVTDTLEQGTSQPAIITHNVPGVYRFGFPRVDKNANTIGLIGSGKSAFLADESDLNWNRRNGLLPVVMTVLGTLLDYQNRDFANADNRATTLMRMKKFSEGLMSNIMPRFYYKKNNNNGNYLSKTWLPRVNGTGSAPHHAYSLRRSFGTDVPNDNSKPWLGWEQRRFFQPIAMRTPLNLLYDSDPTNASGFCDGLLPLAMEYDVTQPRGVDNPPRTRVVTNALKLMMGLTDEKYSDSKTVEELKGEADSSGADYDSTFAEWGTRRRLFYGLEQFSSMTRATKGPLLSLWTEDSSTPFHLTFEPWFFLDGTGASTSEGVTSYTGFNNARPEDIILDESGQLANESLKRSIEKNNADSWNDFQRNQKMMAALLSKKSDPDGNPGTNDGEDYYVLDHLLSIIFDKVLAQDSSPSSSQIAGLLHTFGSLVSTWNSDPDEDPVTEDGIWEFHDDEFKEILFTHLLRVSEITLGEFPELTDPLDIFAAQENKLGYSKLAGKINLENVNGTIRYVLNTLDLSEDVTTEDLVSDVNRFINDKYSLLTDYDSVFWPDVIQLMNDSNRELIKAKYGFDPDEFFGDDFQNNGQIVDYFGN